MRQRVLAATVAWAHVAGFAAVPADALLNATTREPRAFGYQVGDVVSRSVVIHAPAGLVLDETSVPKPGARGKALELRHVAQRSAGEPGGQRIELTLAYQVFLSPPQVRTLEMPSLTLHFRGAPRDQDLRIEAWPLTVAPLVPVEVSPRRGLGELQPDAEPPLIDTTAARHRLVAYASVLLLAMGYLGFVYFGVPWWSRAHRPFAQAWRGLRGIERRAAFQRVHEALNRSASEVLFEPGIARFIGRQPNFAPLRDELVTFFEHSRLEFFGAGAASDAELAWLIEFCRRCRDAERGSR